MPWTAARQRVPTTPEAPPLGARRSLRPILVLGVGVALAGIGADRAAAQTPGDPVLLPAEPARSLDLSTAGWSASAQVTAVGCAPGNCPTATGTWQQSGGQAGFGDGVLRSALSAPSGHSGVATVTWRSPLFLTPAVSGHAAFSALLRTSSLPPGTSVTTASYSVRILNSFSGATKTIVDAVPVPTAEAGWITRAAPPLPAESLAPSTLHRLEIEVRFPIASATEGERAVLFDRPTLSVGQPAPTPDAGAADDGSRSPIDASAVVLAQPDVPLTPGGALARCHGEDVVVLGASAQGRRVSVAGASTQPEGTSVALLTEDGWQLGRAKVQADGRFAATVDEPRGSQGSRRVFARLADGQRSGGARVERRNILRGVRVMGDALVLSGRLAGRRARPKDAEVEVEFLGTGPCDQRRTVPARRVSVDRASGAYRATVPLTALQDAGVPAQAGLLRTRVTASGAREDRRARRSQVFFSAGSGSG